MARKSVSEKPIVVSGGAAPAPVRRKSATPKRAARSAEVAEAADVSAIEPSVIPVEPVAEVLSPAAPLMPSYEEIASLAYSYWEARGFQGGSPETDWLRAERELSAK